MHSSPPPASSTRAITWLSEPPPQATFQSDYLLPLRPLIFHDAHLQGTWPAYRLFTKIGPDGQSVPNVDALAQAYSSCSVTVVTGAVDAGYGEERRDNIAIEEFADRWKYGEPEGHSIYLKDFHLCLARPNLEVYHVYNIFQDDWMNAHALHCTRDDYRFLYLGTSGTTTSFHHDVYLSHSWSTSICGIKRWVLLAPEYAPLLKHRLTGEPVHDLFDEDQNTAIIAGKDYPGLEEARKQCIIVWQYPNETMFVPSGWYHSVRNYGPTLSINHNWSNASCIAGMYAALADQVAQSVELLSDLRPPATSPSIENPSSPPSDLSLSEFYDLVYGNLVRPNWGWSFADFWAVVDWVVENPQGGPRWTLDTRTSTDASNFNRQIADLAQQWLEREEAGCLDDLRETVKGVLTKVQL